MITSISSCQRRGHYFPYFMNQLETKRFQIQISYILSSKVKSDPSHHFYRDISRVLFTLHSLNQPIPHGHLTSHNIFVDADFYTGYKVYIGDLEVQTFLKFATLFNNYTVASVWSSHEVLSQGNKLPEFTKQMDVYSFAIILWEIFHEQIPFDNDLNLAKKYVVNENARPQISDTVD